MGPGQFRLGRFEILKLERLKVPHGCVFHSIGGTTGMDLKSPRVLVLVGVYLPGVKAGGPIRSIANMVEHLGQRMHFSVVTSDRDLGERAPYQGVRAGEWNKVGNAEVAYLPVGLGRLRAMWLALRNAHHDVMYLNSFFSPMFSMVPLALWRLRLVPHVPVVLAPRGELALSALGLKTWKKRLYILVAKLLSLHRGVSWHASSPHEEADIRREFGGVQVTMLPNLASVDRALARPNRQKQPGKLRVVFLARVSRMKNLALALTLLAQVHGDVEYCIVGPCEDSAYWTECETIMSRLPLNVKVVYGGVVANEHVLGLLSEFDLFFVPTLGENFGHAILEALRAGCPVLISDRTPWRNLEARGVGWDLPLDEPHRYLAALRSVVDMDDATWQEWSNRARQLGAEVTGGDELRAGYLRLFHAT